MGTMAKSPESKAIVSATNSEISENNGQRECFKLTITASLSTIRNMNVETGIARDILLGDHRFYNFCLLRWGSLFASAYW